MPATRKAPERGCARGLSVLHAPSCMSGVRHWSAGTVRPGQMVPPPPLCGLALRGSGAERSGGGATVGVDRPRDPADGRDPLVGRGVRLGFACGVPLRVAGREVELPGAAYPARVTRPRTLPPGPDRKG